MPDNFTQYLIIFLILLVGAKDLLVMILKKKGWINGKDNGEYDKRILDLEGHAKVANSEMTEVKENLIALNAKVDILLKKEGL